MPRQHSEKNSTDDFAMPVVALVDKNGIVTHVSTAADVTNLVFGQGYKPRDHDSVQEAYDALSEARSAPQTVEEAVQGEADKSDPDKAGSHH